MSEGYEVPTELPGSTGDPAIVHWTQLMYMVCSCSFLLVSAAVRRALVTNSILPLQSFIGQNYNIWYVVVVLLVSAALRGPCDRLPFTITIVHWTQLLYIIWYVVVARDLYLRSVLATNSLWTQLLYMVRGCSSARECCST